LAATDFRRSDVLAWLAGAPLRHRGRPVPVASWERVSREAGVVAGREHWDRRLDAYAHRCEAREPRAGDGPDAEPWRAQRLRREADAARALRRFALALVDDLVGAASQPRGWAEQAAWARRHLRDLLGGDGHRSGWPEAERRAADRTERALDRLACLETLEGPVSLEVFARTLDLELAADLGRVGRMGEGILVGTVRTGVGVDLDLVILLGLAEGSFPGQLRDDSLLPDREREAAAGELPLRSQETERRHHDLLAVLAGAGHHLLCAPRGDLRRSEERVPSRWLTEVERALARASPPVVQRPWLRHVDSYDAGLRRVAFPATEQEHRLRSLLAGGGGTAPGARLAGALGDPVLAAGAEVLACRRSSRLTRFDGNLAGLPVPSPVAGVTSATRLESWAVCPFAYLMKELLAVRPVESPEDRLRFSPLDRGSLVHEALERFLREVLARPPEDQPAPADPWTAEDHRLLAAIADELVGSYEARGLVGRPILWRHDRLLILGDLERLLDEDSKHRKTHGTRPAAAELTFGLPGSRLGPVALALPDGRSVAFRGSADRLDVADDGTLEVLDYKTGSAQRYSGLSEDDPDAGGTKLQLAVYALAARLHQGLPEAAVRSHYWFVSAKGGFRRIGYAVTVPVLDRVAHTLGQMVGGIEAGTFPNHPTAAATSPYVECPWCDPDSLGVADLRHQIDRKREDPALRVFLGLAERPAGEELGTEVYRGAETPCA
ncbi:MAG: PD-(D/E)XK nuclease family protein, partial [Acidimicrobiales bacterium]